MTEDRVTLNSDTGWLGPDYASNLVDEVVVHNALVHLEMTDDASGYLMIQSPRRHVFVRFHARPTSRVERRQILAGAGETLLDHLASLLPRWAGGRSLWSIPWWQRPTAAIVAWQQCRRAAGAALHADLEEDEEITP